MSGLITTAIKGRNRQDKQNQVKQQALLTAKSQCLFIYFEKTMKKSKQHPMNNKLKQMNCI